MTYYVEPDYWFSGYAEGDSTGTIVFSAALSTATGTAKSAGSYKVGSHAELIQSTSSVLAASALIQKFPGINLNSKSATLAAASVRSSNGAFIVETSNVRASGRIFWEMTTPATGTWTTIVPQAEGSGH